MEKYIFDFFIFLAGAAVVGLVKMAPSGIKGALTQLAKDVAEIKLMLDKMVTEKMCDAYRDKIEGDINNLGAIVREVRGDKK